MKIGNLRSSSKIVSLVLVIFFMMGCERITPENGNAKPEIYLLDEKNNANSRELVLQDEDDIPLINIGLVLPEKIAKDKNPLPNVVEIELTAEESLIEITPGVFSKAYTYNGVIPGPLIKAKVGDTLIVNFKNKLPEPTTIHWHGVRVPADMDGASVAQNPIMPGGKFVYKFTLEDASLFWYHPHVRSNEQVEKGLAGTLLVEDPNEPPELNQLAQNVVVLDDILLDGTGQIRPAFTGTPEEILLEKINGREGNTLLVNGVNAPTIDAEIDKPIRWRMVNVANTRFMRVKIPNTTFTRVGGDGGLLSTPDTDLNEIFLVPGERADVVFTPTGVAGDIIPVYWNDTVRGRHSITITNGKVVMGDDPLDGKQAAEPLLYLKLKAATTMPIAFSAPPTLNPVSPIDISNAKTTTFKFSHGMPMPNGDISFFINGKRFDQLTDADTLDASINDVYIMDLVNTAGGDHPFHLHGFFFHVLEVIEKDKNGDIIKSTKPAKPEDRDMVNLPRRPGAMGSSTTVRIAVDFSAGTGRTDEDIIAFGGVTNITNANIVAGIRGQSGGWQFHCHILEHADTGMMSFVEIR